MYQVLKNYRKITLSQPNMVVKVTFDGAEQESFSEQARLVRTEITFILRKNGGYRTSSLGGKSFLVVRLAGKLTDENLAILFSNV